MAKGKPSKAATEKRAPRTKVRPQRTEAAAGRTPPASDGTSRAAAGAAHEDNFDWRQLEKALLVRDGAPPQRGVRGGLQLPGAEDLFDNEELEELQRVARRTSQQRSAAPVLGNVVFLHGITGSDLEVIDAEGDADKIWVHAGRLVLGRIKDLRLDPSGRNEADPKLKVRAAGINRRYYAKAVLWLRARWNVEPFAYDWRRDLDDASDELAGMIRRRFAGQPVHLVAHSMGGLVARNFIRRHPRVWEEMEGTNLISGGRLVMLGTPNYGSFAIPPVLTGDDRMIDLLAKLDLRQSKNELLDITNSFLGSYMLLPSHSKLNGALQSLYQHQTWGSTPNISQAHLDRTFRFYTDLEATASTFDPRRMAYVAGCRRATITGMSIVGPGEFEYRLSTEGDGRVPHALGALPGVPMYYIDEAHGDLASNEKVLIAVDQLLQTGKTDELVDQPLRALTRAAPTMRDYRSAADLRLMEELDRVADKADQAGGPESLTPDDLKVAADALVKAALGSGSRSMPKSDFGESPERTARRRKGTPPASMAIGVRCVEITEDVTPVVVVGHYQGVQPVHAIGAIDAALGGWITRAMKQRMISGALGETFFIPVPEGYKLIKARGVVIGGMGEFGKFGAADLRLLMSNVALGSGALGFASISTVVIGAGGRSLDRETALLELLEGFGYGLRQLRDEHVSHQPPKRLNIIDNDPQRCTFWLESLQRLRNDRQLENLHITALVDERGAAKGAMRRPAAQRRGRVPAPRAFDEVRITVERPDLAREIGASADAAPRVAKGAGTLGRNIAGNTLFRYSALTSTAVVPVRDVVVQEKFATGAAEALQTARTRSDQEKFGQLLYNYLVPEEFHDLLDQNKPLKLVVDRSTAAFPWEMGCFPGRHSGGGLRWLGTDLRLSRQFRSTLSRAPGLSPAVNERLRVLVIADPAPEPELQLRGARAEGRRVVELFRAAGGKKFEDGLKLKVDVHSRIGAAECEPVEILAMLLSGDFDIVHFAGHGDFDAEHPDSTGWIFGRDTVLTAREIFRARRVPRLVFANACFSGVVRPGVAFAPEEASQALATIAHAFFERGVPNYIGSGWPVDDAQALKMADRFYQALLSRQTVGRALHEGRLAVFSEGIEPTWGAYQHYGDPDETLLPPLL